MSVAFDGDRGGSLHRWKAWFANDVDHDAVLRQIADEAGWSGRYAFLIVISAAISLLGLLMPSVAVLIGAMLLSPLMMPIIGMGFGIATFDFQEIRRSASALAAGALIAVLLSIVLVSVSPIQTITSEIAGRTRPTLFDLLVALLSAVAGAYALIRGRGGTVVGVAIAIALMPPLVVVGFGIATGNMTVFMGSLLLFLTNAVTIALTVALVARAYGFGSHLSPHHTGWQVTLFIVAVGLLALPLVAGLRQIAFESVAQRQVRDTVRARFAPEARLSQLDIDYSAQPMRVRAVMVTPRLVPQADRLLTADLQERLARPVNIHIDQLRVSLDSGAAEAAQIARAGEGPELADSRQQSRAVADLALIAGVEPAAVRVDGSAHSLSAVVAPLPGLGLDGYRALEDRARRQLPDWTVALAPPTDTPLPAMTIRQGVLDDAALGLAAWGSARLSRAVLVDGGTSGQRAAVAEGIVARGGTAEPGRAGGRLSLRWSQEAGETISNR
ncbi:DUF389 domain-containing protein [Sphingomonas jatrophae]|uniref:Uncharacterized hydrophobic domain-containing protein n=1 Tax=Sphingomonas jatrophae TaxID=1166337 RepID=A0A1I6M9M7_9SPHN|nr:DUF389 domain-containing protein [Sphingomonas jatrophae]SFS12426.1 uncharacterized hydrophobic domain-containing protein [Sphingomonas jatrophae]